MSATGITGHTVITGIFGFPVAHSMSPAMHNAAFKKLSLDWAYLPFEVAPSRLSSAVASISALNIRGVNVTIPHKEAVLAHLDIVDPLAKSIGSVNTIVNNHGRLTGYNTDGPGFLEDLLENGFNPAGKNVLLIGAGGAGRAIAHTLSKNGAKNIYLFDTDRARAAKLAAMVKRAQPLDPGDIFYAAMGSQLIVNATPVGMRAGDRPPLPKRALRPGIFVYDVVYNRRTQLICEAQKIGCKCSNGLGMLLNQGALAFEKWTGKKAPLPVMRSTLLGGI